MQSFQCTEVRDRLFGVLALIEWGTGESAVPDCGKDNYQVAIEVLRLYLDNSENEPVLGMAVEWPRQLWEIFNVKVEGQAMREAITKRYGSHVIPDQMSSAYGTIDSRPISKLRSSSNNRKTYLQSPPTRYQNFLGHPRDTWYGVKLLDTIGIGEKVPSSRGPQPYYLCREANYSRRARKSERPLVKIMDQEECLFANAPAGTRPDDWLLISEAASLSDISPAMVVVKNTNRSRGIYQIIGQASKDRGYEKIIFPFLDWKYFGPHWYAEDLFPFDWMYINRSLGAQTTKTTSDWFRMTVCAYEDSSFFYGPIARDTVDTDIDLNRFPPRYNDRRVHITDFELENPFLVSFLDNEEEYEYLLSIT